LSHLLLPLHRQPLQWRSNEANQGCIGVHELINLSERYTNSPSHVTRPVIVEYAGQVLRGQALVDRHLIDRYLIDRHFTDGYLVNGYLVDRYLIDGRLMDVRLTGMYLMSVHPTGACLVGISHWHISYITDS
jgi:hypothetical protein